jgi:hypothetical protein
MDWRCGLSSREPALQVPALNLNPKPIKGKKPQKTKTIIQPFVIELLPWLCKLQRLGL